MGHLCRLRRSSACARKAAGWARKKAHRKARLNHDPASSNDEHEDSLRIDFRVVDARGALPRCAELVHDG
jgi:hypothetical protein